MQGVYGMRAGLRDEAPRRTYIHTMPLCILCIVYEHVMDLRRKILRLYVGLQGEHSGTPASASEQAFTGAGEQAFAPPGSGTPTSTHPRHSGKYIGAGVHRGG
jgi:hypothetical protein